MALADGLFSETGIRLGSFLAVFLLMAAAEAIWPRRPRVEPALKHQTRNLGVILLSTVAARLAALLPIFVPVGVAAYAVQQGVGWFHWQPVPTWAAWLATVLVLDALIYGQHIAFHKIPLLWRLHRVHHTDLDLDASSGIRFHPVEIVLSLGVKSGVVALLGAPVGAVILFEVLLNATSLFNHANLAIPEPVDRVLRLLVVTPDMHRVHHSVYRDETDSNFGFNFPWWDRLFRTYRPLPRDGHTGMRVGVDGGGSTPRSLWNLLVLPFRRL